MKKKIFSILGLSLLFLIALTPFSFSQEKTFAEAKFYLLEGEKFFNKGEYDKAIQKFKRAIELEPKLTLAYYNIGVCYQYKGKEWINEATNWYRKALELDPKLANAYYNIGVIAFNKGDYDSALKNFEKAKELNPKDKEINNAIELARTQAKIKEIKKEEVKREVKKEAKVEIKKEKPAEVVKLPPQKIKEKKKRKRIEKVAKKEKRERVKPKEEVVLHKVKTEEISKPYISRLLFCGDVKNREPIGENEVFKPGERVFIFIELKNIKGRNNLQLKWITPAGNIKFSDNYKFTSSGERYRTWFWRKIKDLGKWKVEVYLNGELLKDGIFSVI